MDCPDRSSSSGSFCHTGIAVADLEMEQRSSMRSAGYASARPKCERPWPTRSRATHADRSLPERLPSLAMPAARVAIQIAHWARTGLHWPWTPAAPKSIVMQSVTRRNASYSGGYGAISVVDRWVRRCQLVSMAAVIPRPARWRVFPRSHRCVTFWTDLAQLVRTRIAGEAARPGLHARSQSW